MKTKHNMDDDSHLYADVSDDVMDAAFIAKWSIAAVAAQAAIGQLRRCRSKKIDTTLGRLEVACELDLAHSAIRFLPAITDGRRRRICMASHDAEMLALLEQIPVDFTHSQRA
jgi:hypothetical protein